MAHLLDANVLIALSVEGHVHHRAAARWWTAPSDPVATCPMTQGALLRLLVREGLEGTQAVRVLHQFTSHPRHRFWPDSLGYETVDLGQVFGHGHFTDAYLVALARDRGGHLATFGRDLAKQAPTWRP